MTSREGRGGLSQAARLVVGVVALPLVLAGVVFGQGLGSGVILGRGPRLGTGSRVRVELKARGLFRPGIPPGFGSRAVKMPKPLALEVETRLIFSERAVLVGREGRLVDAREASTLGLKPGEGGRTVQVVRQVIQAASAINGEVRPQAAAIRPTVALLVAQRPEPGGPVVVASPGGPLTRSELELVQGLGDPLALADLLPEQAVAQGSRYKPSLGGALAISGYDTVTVSTLEGVVEALDERSCRLKISGRIEGQVLGGSGVMTCDGFLTYDRKHGWLDRLEMNRMEVRQPGPIEAGLEVKSTLTASRQAESPPATLSDQGLAGTSLAITPERLLLRQSGPGGASVLFHDRDWHVFWEDSKVVVLKRLDRGRVVAQLNLSPAPAAGQARRQDPAVFREDVRKALKDRFVRVIGEGDVAGDPAGGRRYKVGIEGREGNLPIVWYYYLATSPGGDQLLATFTLAAAAAAQFGDRDEAIMASLRWETAARGDKLGSGAAAPVPRRQ